ncbi:hypothetical protein V6U90_08015 [Micromonospora sp. CPCC 206060]|uniref:hypothetical protein n=1 Tax=Micromonospora sp. CPCC 206060 TaxID=3122406 RepID=UPI002FF0A924
MVIPTNGYVPDRVTYHVHNPNPMARDLITLDITINGENTMEPDEADALLRPHMEALLAEVVAASSEPSLRLLRTYHGRRDEDLTPEPPA